MTTRCQICGRRKHTRKMGGIVMHHVNSDRCPGTGHPPIEYDDSWLRQCTREASAAWTAAQDEIDALVDARANYIEPRLINRRNYLLSVSCKLDARLRRIDGWAARYARTFDRQMMTQGYVWADKPPAYLIERYCVTLPVRPDAYREEWL